jgi:MOSC domain-containing protein YiiM
MTVVALCFSPTRAVPVSVVPSVDVVAAGGIVGDRHYNDRKSRSGKDITLIEAEEVEGFNARLGRVLAPTDTRRNIVTRGVRLNDLVGKRFRVGDVTLLGVELCEPCSVLAGYLAGPDLTKKAFIREFAHRCGLRADVVSSGTIRVGDPVLELA